MIECRFASTIFLLLCVEYFAHLATRSMLPDYRRFLWNATNLTPHYERIHLAFPFILLFISVGKTVLKGHFELPICQGIQTPVQCYL